MSRPPDQRVIRMPEPVSLTPGSSAILDSFRSLAAVSVMFSHLRGFCFVDYAHIEPSRVTVLVKLLYFATRFGHESVMIFFVLSGFFIASSIFRSINRHTYSWQSYAVDRVARLYTVLIPGLLLGGACDWIGVRFFNAAGAYTVPAAPYLDLTPLRNLTPLTFLGNLFFVQARFVPVWGSNGPLWSLFNEAWYYVLFPAIVATFIAFRRSRFATAFGCSLLAVFCVWILQRQIEGFFAWLMGAAVSIAANLYHSIPARFVLPYIIIAFLLFLVCLQYSHQDLGVALGFSVLLYGALLWQAHVPAGFLSLAKCFAGFSYSLYVLHFPVLFLIRAANFPRSYWQPDVLHLAYAAVISAGVLLYAFVSSRFTEAHTSSVRKLLRSHLLPATAPVIPEATLKREVAL